MRRSVDESLSYRDSQIREHRRLADAGSRLDRHDAAPAHKALDLCQFRLTFEEIGHGPAREDKPADPHVSQ